MLIYSLNGLLIDSLPQNGFSVINSDIKH